MSDSGNETTGEDAMVKLNGHSSRTARPLRGMALAIVAAVAWLGISTAAIAAEPRQTTFASPEEATDALVAAAQAGKTADLKKILGPSGRKLIHSGDRVADKEGREKFVSAYTQKHAIDNQSDTKAILIIGADRVALPDPARKARRRLALRHQGRRGRDSQSSDRAQRAQRHPGLRRHRRRRARLREQGPHRRRRIWNMRRNS